MWSTLFLSLENYLCVWAEFEINTDADELEAISIRSPDSPQGSGATMSIKPKINRQQTIPNLAMPSSQYALWF